MKHCIICISEFSYLIAGSNRNLNFPHFTGVLHASMRSLLVDIQVILKSIPLKRCHRRKKI